MWNVALIFSNKRHGLQKIHFIEKNRFFSVDSVTINELHVVSVVYTWLTCNLSRWNNGGNDTYKKGQKELKHFEKIGFLINFG